MPNVPNGRDKKVTGQGKSVYKRGDGLGTGPVGNAGGYQGRPGTTGASSGGQSTGNRAGGRRSPLLIIIILAVLLLGGGGAGLGGLLGGGSTTNIVPTQPTQQPYIPQPTQQPYIPQPSSNGQTTSTFDLSSLLGGLSASTTSTGWSQKTNTGVLDTSVASGARAKYTKIRGGGSDTVTIMVYMCGTDLESQSGMGTADLQEMASATIGSNVNLLVFTGGCKRWQNNIISSSVNQIYKVESGGLRCLEKDAGTSAMTNPDNLSSYIKYCAKNYKADRYMLIFWDHGGGSLSGYGYDEKNTRSGSMTLAGINQALKNGGVKFDMIGFDACLMATTENALMLGQYGDYMVASEESEPGVGWYYTNWLTKLSKNTSMPTVEIGKAICDDFVDVCAQKCAGQKTTLSVVDLAELAATVPGEFKDFCSATTQMIDSKQYQAISEARSGAREFSASSKLDQVDLVSFAGMTGTKEGADLANALRGAIKYNRTSPNMTDAYGLSIYFPYKKASAVNNALNTFDDIGMDEEYLDCIRAFATVQVGGQAVAGGSSTGNPLFSLLGGSYGGTTSSSNYTSSSAGTMMDSDMIGSLLSGLLGGSSTGNIAGLTSGSTGSFFGRGMDMDGVTEYLTDNRFDTGALVWLRDSEGRSVIQLSEDQWNLVQELELNVFVDDGEGYIDLGLDNIYEITEEGGLVGDYDGTWLAINGQPVAFYYMDTVQDGDSYMITGRVPVLLNDVRADLILVFDNDHPDGYVAGARYDYRDGETETVAKSFPAVNEGDKIDFLCDYYSYGGEYLDSYMLGDAMTVNGELEVSYVYLSEPTSATYRFTDIYQQEYWTPTMN